jgi:transposase
MEAGMSKLFWLNDRQWAKMAPLLPRYVRGKKRVDDRRVISGIIHVLRSGCRWSEAPEAYGPSKTLYNRFVRWSLRGVWQAMFAALAATGGPPAEALLDSTHIKVHRSASGGKGGIKRKPSVVLVVGAIPNATPSATRKGGRVYFV